ncbi:putative membrane protein [Synechococcus sp. A15-24]|nr:putative membrane protein [Synechococcus sp. A15-24]
MQRHQDSALEVLGSNSIHFTYLPMVRLVGLNDSESRFATKSLGVKVALF